jgi:hypothetical protein
MQEYTKAAWEMTKTPEFRASLEADIAKENEGVTHADFVAGVQGGTLGFKCMRGEPSSLVTGLRKTIFNLLVLLYTVAPLFLVSPWAFHERNWWLLMGIPVCYVATYSATRGSKIIFLFLCVCIGVWIRSGFSIHQYISFFFFCALWGYMLFQIAESAQNEYAMQLLVENPGLFARAIAEKKIMIVRKQGEATSGAQPGADSLTLVVRPVNMHELFKIVLTASLTLAGGVILLVITQVFTRFVVDPLVDFRRLLGEIGHTLVFYSNYLHNPSVMASTPEFKEATLQCRALASRLRSFSNAVPLYATLARIRLVPAHQYVYDASADLIGLSNTTSSHSPDVVRQHYERISELLDIQVD